MAYMRLSLPLGICVLFFINIVNVLAGVTPNELALALLRRDTFTGGFALAQQRCPSGTISCPENGGITARSCCPSNTACRQHIFATYCCPSQTDCFPNLDTFPVCADPSWGLYRGKGVTEFFCCPANQKGVYPGPGVGAAGLCVASDMSVAVTQTAPKYRSAGSSPATSGSATTTAQSTAAQTSATQSASQSASTQGPVASTSATTPASTPTKSSRAAGSRGSLAEVGIVKAIGAIGLLFIVIL